MNRYLVLKRPSVAGRSRTWRKVRYRLPSLTCRLAVTPRAGNGASTPPANRTRWPLRALPRSTLRPTPQRTLESDRSSDRLIVAVAEREVDEVDLARRGASRQPERDLPGLGGGVRLTGDLPVRTLHPRGCPHLGAGDRLAAGGAQQRAQGRSGGEGHRALGARARDAAALSLARTMLDAHRCASPAGRHGVVRPTSRRRR